jgi:hypothetical protein
MTFWLKNIDYCFFGNRKIGPKTYMSTAKPSQAMLWHFITDEEKMVSGR